MSTAVATATKQSLAELARDAEEHTNGRELLDALCHAVDGIPDEAVIESEDYRKVSQRIATLLYAPGFTTEAETAIKTERAQTGFMFPL